MQSFWLGVAAIASCVVLLLLVYCTARRCCCAWSRSSLPCEGARQGNVGAAVWRVTKLEEDTQGADPAPFSQKERAPEKFCGGADATALAMAQPAALATQTASRPPSALLVPFSQLARHPRSYGALETSNELLHPYNLLSAEVGAPPATRQSCALLSSKKGNGETAAVAEGRTALLLSPHRSSVQETVALAEELTGSINSATCAMRLDGAEKMYEATALSAHAHVSSQDVAQEEVVFRLSSYGRLRPLSPNQSNPGRSCTPELLKRSKSRGQAVVLTGEGKASCTTTSSAPSAPLTAPPLLSLHGHTHSAGCGRTTSALDFTQSQQQKRAMLNEGAEDEEAVIRQQTLLGVNLQARREELQSVQEELRAVLRAKEHAETTKQRIEVEVRDMERYKSTLDGIVAFTLRELEDAADGVEEAEAQMRRSSQLALQDVLAAQEALRQRSLELKDDE